MNNDERDKLYNRIYDDFVKLIRGEINEVIISDYEFYELNKVHYWTDTDGLIVYGIVRNNSYADALRENFKNKNIVQSVDIMTRNYIFRLGGNK